MLPSCALIADILLERVIAIAWQAGELVLSYRKKGVTTHHKEDDSPVTDADIAAQQFIDAQLIQLMAQECAPSCPIIGEENTHETQAGDFFWLIDPIDGTRDFIRGRDCFTVNIALIKKGVPILGVIVAPSWEGGVCYGAHLGVGAFKAWAGGAFAKIKTRLAPPKGMVAAISHWATDDDELEILLGKYDIAERVAIGSSIKFCFLAEGKCDIYPRPAPTMEWDTAAGDAILRVAGGTVCDLEGNLFLYGKKEYRNGGFIAWGRP